jgi:ATP-dependent Clp protease protease subunit
MAITKVAEPKEDSRRIYFTGEFKEENTKEIITSLLDLEAKNPLLDIIIYISSYGGVIDDFIAIHDTIKMMRCKVATVCIGKSMSCGVMLLMTGTKGYRFITPNARIMIHQLSAGTFGKLHELDNDLDEYHRMQEIIDRMILQYTKIPKKDLKSILEKDSFYNAQDAVKLGVADEIVTSNSQLYRKLKL